MAERIGKALNRRGMTRPATAIDEEQTSMARVASENGEVTDVSVTRQRPSFMAASKTDSSELPASSGIPATATTS
jgi:hypothetical protein